MRQKPVLNRAVRKSEAKPKTVKFIGEKKPRLVKDLDVDEKVFYGLLTKATQPIKK